MRHSHRRRDARRMTWRRQRRKVGKRGWRWSREPLESIARSSREQHVTDQSFNRSLANEPDKEELFDDCRRNCSQWRQSQQESSKSCRLIGVVSSAIVLQSALRLFLKLLYILRLAESTSIWKNMFSVRPDNKKWISWAIRIQLFVFLSVWPVKLSPNVYKKWPKNDFTRKMKDFDTFTKID